MSDEKIQLFADPDTIAGEQVKAAYEALGLDPAAFHSTNLIKITPHCVTLSRFWRDENGEILLAFDEKEHGSAAVEVLAEIEIKWSGEVPHAD